MIKTKMMLVPSLLGFDIKLNFIFLKYQLRVYDTKDIKADVTKWMAQAVWIMDQNM